MKPFERFDALEKACFSWWAVLANPDDQGRMTAGADRAALARLRRLGSAAEADLDAALATALSEPAFCGGFQQKGRRHEGLLDRISVLEGAESLSRKLLLAPKVLVAAIVMADIRRSRPETSVGKLLRDAQSDAEGITPSGKARFLRLLRTDEVSFLLPQARRLTRLLDREAPVGQLGASLILWADPRDGASRRSRWALDFFQPSLAADAAPSPSETTP
jgi:hypothetical protein